MIDFNKMTAAQIIDMVRNGDIDSDTFYSFEEFMKNAKKWDFVTKNSIVFDAGNGDYLSDWGKLEKENKRLKEENTRLKTDIRAINDNIMHIHDTLKRTKDYTKIIEDSLQEMRNGL